MNTAAIYHRPESEFAYLYTPDLMHIRLRTAKGDIQNVELLSGDPYQLEHVEWYKKSLKMEKYLSTELNDYWIIEVTAPYRRLSYAFKLTGEDGTTIFYGDHGIYPYQESVVQTANNYFKLPYFHEVDRFKAPEWVTKTIWYQIFPERFANGDTSNDPVGTLPWGSKEHPDRDDFFGGDLQGVLDHLDHLVDLGINGIYFCPLFKASSNHKYDTIDYYEIDPAFGDKKLFKKVVEECHKRGIRVMLDAVFNHIGDHSPQWQDVIENGEQSKYANWFHIRQFPVTYTPTDNFEFASDATYDTFAFTPHMPKLNTANPEVQKYLLDITKYWIQEFDIDAWRLDVANEIDHRFWQKFRDACLETKEDFYILGEIWHSSQRWLQGDGFHAVMNYAFTDAIISYFIKKEISMEKFISELNTQFMLYREQTNQVMFNILDSHDTPRILTVANENKHLTKQVFTFMYLQKGVPCLYYGDEYGMTGEMDPDCRKCMIWDEEEQDLDMYAFIRELIAFRKKNQELLTKGKLRWLEVEPEKGYLEFAYQYNGQALVGMFNTGNKELRMPTENLLFSHLVEQKNEHLMEIEPNGFAVYVVAEEKMKRRFME